MLNQSTEALCISVSFQGSRDWMIGEPVTNVHNMLHHVRGDFKAV